jgi:hypothetical protein
MRKFRVTVQLNDLRGNDAAGVREALDAQLRGAGFVRWRVTSVEAEESGQLRSLRSLSAVQIERVRRPANIGGFLLAGAVAWALWFFWSLLGE